MTRNRPSRRVLLKLSGESLGGSRGEGFDSDTLRKVAGEISEIVAGGVQIGIVVGGGNFFRGLSSGLPGCDRISADHIGMLATVMNALALGHALTDQGRQIQVFSAFAVAGIAEPFSVDAANRCLDRGDIAVFGGGTGNPLFTTDTAASLRAVECRCDLLIKATRVDGVFDSDPETNPSARRFAALTFNEVIEKRLAVMDTSAFSVCRDADLPICVIDIAREAALANAIAGMDEGTLIS